MPLVDPNRIFDIVPVKKSSASKSVLPSVFFLAIASSNSCSNAARSDRLLTASCSAAMISSTSSASTLDPAGFLPSGLSVTARPKILPTAVSASSHRPPSPSVPIWSSGSTLSAAYSGLLSWITLMISSSFALAVSAYVRSWETSPLPTRP